MNTALHISEDTLNAWLDHELPASDGVEIEAHLASCPACRQAADEIDALRTALAALPQAEPPRSFRLTPEQAQRRPAPARPSVVRLMPAVRALSIAAVMAFLVLSAALTFGPVSGPGETDGSSGASMTQEVQATGGGLVDQGQAAANDAESSTGLVAAPKMAAAPAAAAPEAATGSDEAGLSALQWATIGTGVAAAALVGSWLVLARTRSADRPR